MCVLVVGAAGAAGKHVAAHLPAERVVARLEAYNLGRADVGLLVEVVCESAYHIVRVAGEFVGHVVKVVGHLLFVEVGAHVLLSAQYEPVLLVSLRVHLVGGGGEMVVGIYYVAGGSVGVGIFVGAYYKLLVDVGGLVVGDLGGQVHFMCSYLGGRDVGVREVAVAALLRPLAGAVVDGVAVQCGEVVADVDVVANVGGVNTRVIYGDVGGRAALVGRVDRRGAGDRPRELVDA